MASDENHRPCLPLKPQEKKYIELPIIMLSLQNLNEKEFRLAQIFRALTRVKDRLENEFLEQLRCVKIRPF